MKTHFASLLKAKQTRDGASYPYRTIAAQAHLSTRTIVQWQHSRIARVDLKTLDRLCTWLNCAIGQLLELDPIA